MRRRESGALAAKNKARNIGGSENQSKWRRPKISVVRYRVIEKETKNRKTSGVAS
jgi:hypothetical protein